MSSPRITVTIDTLALRGFAPEQRHALAAGLRAELSRLFPGLHDATTFGESRSIAHLQAGKMEIAADASPRNIGSLAAQHIVHGVKP